MSTETELDTRGLRCPEPIMMLHKAIRNMAVDEVVHLLATDPATERDVAKFCEFLPHQLIKTETQDDEYHYWIKKGSR